MRGCVLVLAVGPGGEALAVFDRNALQAPPGGVSIPIALHLAPGEMREFVYPMNRFLCVVNRQDVPLAKLLQQGYRVRAKLLL